MTDCGSNLASKLCEAVMRATGVDMYPTAAEHHEGVGFVERFNRTLVEMTRAADEGGRHWVDHLPFLLFSYRATPPSASIHGWYWTAGLGKPTSRSWRL